MRKTVRAGIAAIILSFSGIAAPASATIIYDFYGFALVFSGGPNDPFRAYEINWTFLSPDFLTPSLLEDIFMSPGGLTIPVSWLSSCTAQALLQYSPARQVSCGTSYTVQPDSAGRNSITFSIIDSDHLSYDILDPGAVGVAYFAEPHVFTQIGFYQTGNGNGTLTVRYPDAIPEPASWALMLAGFCIVGGAMRRRAARVSFV
jgi:PEP-CTERM motif